MFDRFILLIIVFIFSSVHAQEKKYFENLSASAQYFLGSYITTVPKSGFLKDAYSEYTELSFSRPVYNDANFNTANKTGWGIGIFYGNTGSKEYIGKMCGLFPFLNFELMSKGFYSTDLRVGMGAGYIEKPYNSISNHKNVLIGSHGNIYINFLWKNQIVISNKLCLNAGISFSHLSNANTKLPNLGLNIPAFTAGISFKFNNKDNYHTNKDTQIIHLSHFHVHGSVGIKQFPWIGSSRYGTVIIGVNKMKPNLKNDEFGFDISIFYDPSARYFYLDTIVTKGSVGHSIFNAGPSFIYEKHIRRLSIPIQFGVYMLNSIQGRFFQNIGLKYSLNRHINLQGLLLAHWGKADFLNAGIDYLL